ncbi:hypothetical protein [Streptomyces sp. NPDC085665]|uniref:hypothetical protein n=1 Tax=Streptomyces sp. NPDC085665 TaxID=3365735 RepID=UPI0037CED0FD
MSNVFDLDVWASEARRTPFQFTVSGQTFTLPAAGDLDKRILSAVNVDAPSAADIVSLLRAALADQWPTFDALPVSVGALGELFRRWQRHEGIPLGESVASDVS